MCVLVCAECTVHDDDARGTKLLAWLRLARARRQSGWGMRINAKCELERARARLSRVQHSFVVVVEPTFTASGPAVPHSRGAWCVLCGV